MIIVTGGAGFIGSCMVRTLNDMGVYDIIVVDNIASTDKWMNLRNKKYIEYIHRDEFLQRLPEFKGLVSHIIHLGACSATTEKNFDFLYKNNLEFSKTLWNYCAKNNISFIYASSAATYGDGQLGFDDKVDISRYLPLNGYGYSKQLFDLWVEQQLYVSRQRPMQTVGLKFFNVYGPNEYFKGSMASVIFHTYNDVMETGKKGLFKSYKSEYEDGGQLRDFVYVKDVCRVIRFMMDNPAVNGLFNVGTGVARSFRDLALATFAAMGKEPNIEYIEMPEGLKEKYQYFTQANIEKLRNVGYLGEFCTLEEGAKDYVQNYLMKNREVY